MTPLHQTGFMENLPFTAALAIDPINGVTVSCKELKELFALKLIRMLVNLGLDIWPLLRNHIGERL